jgi:hypothetical protein
MSLKKRHPKAYTELKAEALEAGRASVGEETPLLRF